jgi:hypothetical protein
MGFRQYSHQRGSHQDKRLFKSECSMWMKILCLRFMGSTSAKPPMNINRVIRSVLCRAVAANIGSFLARQQKLKQMGPYLCAGINRHEVENERVLQERSSEPSYVATNRKKRGEGKPETFDFPGFTHMCGNGGKTGYFIVKHHTVKKRMRAKLQVIKDEFRRQAYSVFGWSGSGGM